VEGDHQYAVDERRRRQADQPLDPERLAPDPVGPPLDVPLGEAEQRSRLDQRLAEASHTTWDISDNELVAWAANIDIPTPGELDGSEPIDDPPSGFATWDDWRAHRWPPSVA